LCPVRIDFQIDRAPPAARPLQLGGAKLSSAALTSGFKAGGNPQGTSCNPTVRMSRIAAGGAGPGGRCRALYASFNPRVVSHAPGPLGRPFRFRSRMLKALAFSRTLRFRMPRSPPQDVSDTDVVGYRPPCRANEQSLPPLRPYAAGFAFRRGGSPHGPLYGQACISAVLGNPAAGPARATARKTSIFHAPGADPGRW